MNYYELRLQLKNAYKHLTKRELEFKVNPSKQADKNLTDAKKRALKLARQYQKTACRY